MQQILLTPAAGKRLIGKALAAHPEIKQKLVQGTVVIIAGTTNGCIAEEILSSIGVNHGLQRGRFIRGITLPPGYKVSAQGRLPDESEFPGDVVIQNGVWLKGQTINDVADGLKEGDIVLKGANALDPVHRRAAVLIGNPTGGTIVPTLKALIGRRIRLILPVGLEKRIPGDLDDLANKINLPGAPGWRLLPVPGEVFTEIDALSMLTGVSAEIFASGGICGAEGSVYLLISGTAAQEKAAAKIVKSIASEPPFSLA
jgi:hypothetical protein